MASINDGGRTVDREADCARTQGIVKRAWGIIDRGGGRIVLKDFAKVSHRANVFVQTTVVSCRDGITARMRSMPLFQDDSHAHIRKWKWKTLVPITTTREDGVIIIIQ
jgi:hypothetical protein